MYIHSFIRYHCECLNPPLAEVPAEEWYCPDCEILQEREREGRINNIYIE